MLPTEPYCKTLMQKKTNSLFFSTVSPEIWLNFLCTENSIINSKLVKQFVMGKLSRKKVGHKYIMRTLTHNFLSKHRKKGRMREEKKCVIPKHPWRSSDRAK